MDVQSVGEELAEEIMGHAWEKMDGKPVNIAMLSPALAASHMLLQYAQMMQASGNTGDDPLVWAIKVLTEEWSRVQEIGSVRVVIPHEAKH